MERRVRPQHVAAPPNSPCASRPPDCADTWGMSYRGGHAHPARLLWTLHLDRTADRAIWDNFDHCDVFDLLIELHSFSLVQNWDSLGECMERRCSGSDHPSIVRRRLLLGAAKLLYSPNGSCLSTAKLSTGESGEVRHAELRWRASPPSTLQARRIIR
jgi:hypothetical protein